MLTSGLLKVQAQSSVLAIADSLYQSGNYSKAISYYQKMGALVKARLKIAKAYNSIGNYDKAIEVYETVVKNNNDLQIAQYELGRLYIKRKRFENAMPIFEDLVSKDSTNPNYHYQLALVSGVKNDSVAMVHYKKAIAIDSTHLKSLIKVSRYYLIKGIGDSLYLYSDKGLLFDPNNVDLLNLQSIYLYNRGQHIIVKPMLEKLVNLGQDSEAILGRLADTYFYLEKYEKSLKLYLMLLEKDPKNSAHHFNVGKLYRSLKKPKEALPYFKTALKIKKPSLKSEYASIAWTYIEMDEKAKAVKYIDLCLREKPADLMNYYIMVRVIDERFNDSKLKLHYFRQFKKNFPDMDARMKEYIEGRISDLKSEIHLATE